jgi:hypothetical protein
MHIRKVWVRLWAEVCGITAGNLWDLVCAAGLEPAISCVTGRCSNQLNYAPAN